VLRCFDCNSIFQSPEKKSSFDDDDEDYEDYENSAKSEDGENVGGIYAKEKPVSSSSLFQVTIL
jgi:hypothetical protein